MAATGIPLHCNICPKKPDFSDVSHLLTHIASKGHLSNYYKVKVRSSHEEASRRLIEAYDRWYSEWGVEELMSERMSQKDKRRTRARPAARPTPAPKIDAPMPRPVRRAAVGNLVDPRLVEQQQRAIKLEQSPSPSPKSQPTGPVLRHRNTYAPHMQYWPTDSRASSLSYTNPDYETSSEYSDPSERRRYRYAESTSCAVDDEPVGAPDPMAVSESTRLKGVYWPGMDIFDSATPEMRRKRNQKKDSSVVKQLELNSQGVEATELIFTPQGSFKRQRRISCSESDEEGDMDIKTESPQPVRRRPVLANMDVNIRHSRPLKQPMFPFPGRSQYDSQSRSSYDFTQGRRTSKRKRFEVFHDEEDDTPLARPSNMNYLTSGFVHDPSPAPTSGFVSYKPYNDPFQFENKENVLPPFHHTALDSPHTHQSNNYHYTPCTHSFGHGPYGLQYSGLLYNNQQLEQDNNDYEDDDQRTLTAPPSPATS